MAYFKELKPAKVVGSTIAIPHHYEISPTITSLEQFE